MTFLKKRGYSILLKTKISYAQRILNQNFAHRVSKASTGKRGHNDRSKKSVAVDGKTYYLDYKMVTYDKWHIESSIIDA